jgi:hypothetical protein
MMERDANRHGANPSCDEVDMAPANERFREVLARAAVHDWTRMRVDAVRLS